MNYRFYFYAAIAFYCMGVMSMSSNIFFGIANIAVGCWLQTNYNRKRKEAERQGQEEELSDKWR